MLVYIVPGPGRRNREVHYDVRRTSGAGIDDWNGEWLGLAAVSRVHEDFAAHQGRHAKGAPHAGSPPA
jgi:hypothetical protein